MSKETPAERQEAAATRRRWITLAEVLAVAGVLIAALTLWSNWADRRADETEKSAEASNAARDKARLDLTGTVERDGAVLALTDPRHDLQDAVIRFPTPLGVAVQRPAGDPEIAAQWVARALLKLTDGGADERTGRLPVLITVRYWDGDVARSTSGVYDIVWRTKGQLLRGRALLLEGLKLRQRGGSQAAVDAAWKRVRPAADPR